MACLNQHVTWKHGRWWGGSGRDGNPGQSVKNEQSSQRARATEPGELGKELGVWIGHGGEFDPGSGSTLAACLMHASRTGCFRALTWRTGEEHVGNLS